MRVFLGSARPVIRWAAAVALTTTLAGCGITHGEDSGEGGGSTSTPAGSLRLVSHALATGDGVRVCSLLYGEAQLTLQRSVGSSNCVDAVVKLHRSMDARARDALLAAGSVHIRTEGHSAAATGPGATAVAAALGLRSPLTLSPFEDDWMIQRSSKEPGIKKTAVQ